MKYLLDYVFPISVITPTPAASTAFLKQACVVAKPKSGQEGNVGSIFECTSMTQVAARTDNTNAQQLFNAGMAKVYILLANDLDLEDFLSEGKGSDFWTLLISDDFDDDDINTVIGTPAVAASLVKDDLTFTAVTPGVAGNSLDVEFLDDTTAGLEWAHFSGSKLTIHGESTVSTANALKAAVDDSVSGSSKISVTVADGQGSSAQTAFVSDDLENGADAITSSAVGVTVGTWDGIIGTFSSDTEVCAEQAAVENRVCFYGNVTNKAKNMMYAFGKLLSNSSNWLNQQYITMPFDDEIETLGAANSLFDDKVSFVISDDEFGKRLGLFAVGGKAIVAPYILKNLRIDLQSASLSWISGNQPQYTLKEASLLETRLQQDVINEDYIERGLIEAGIVQITLVNENFVATGAINVSEPKALWRVFNEMRQTL